MTLRGKYHELSEFVYLLESVAYITQVRHLAFSTPDMTSSEISSELKISFLMAASREATATETETNSGASYPLIGSHHLLHSYFLEKDVYSKDLVAIGFRAEKLVTEDGPARYKIEISEVSPSGFRATALAVVDFDRDGVFNRWSIDVPLVSAFSFGDTKFHS